MTAHKEDTDKGAGNREHACCGALPAANGEVQTGTSKEGSKVETVLPVVRSGVGVLRQDGSELQRCED